MLKCQVDDLHGDTKSHSGIVYLIVLGCPIAYKRTTESKGKMIEVRLAVDLAELLADSIRLCIPSPLFKPLFGAFFGEAAVTGKRMEYFCGILALPLGFVFVCSDCFCGVEVLEFLNQL